MGDSLIIENDDQESLIYNERVIETPVDVANEQQQQQEQPQQQPLDPPSISSIAHQSSNNSNISISRTKASSQPDPALPPAPTPAPPPAPTLLPHENTSRRIFSRRSDTVKDDDRISSRRLEENRTPSRAPSRASSAASLASGPAFRVYKRRWLILIAASMLNLTNALNWLSFAPIATRAAEYFHVGADDVDWFGQVFFISGEWVDG